MRDDLLHENRIVWIDIETDDRFHPDTCNPIQIACLATDRDTLQAIERFEVKIQFPVNNADLGTLDRNCYDALVWEREAIPPRAAISKLSRFFNNHATWERTNKAGNVYTTCEVGGHNIAAYDALILANWYKSFDEYCPAALWATGPVDTMHWARAIEFARGERWGFFNLKDLCERFGILLENEHDALEDVRATVELARALRQLTINYKAKRQMVTLCLNCGEEAGYITAVEYGDDIFCSEMCLEAWIDTIQESEVLRESTREKLNQLTKDDLVLKSDKNKK